ncbi:MAG: DUF4177 domain-containing protein [Flavobacteriaceae bacterium]|nr:DUF4177 domain-containing protein [Flavobacteriaceae bacterium]
MKEYKVVQPKIGFRNRNQKYEDVLNQYARDGWVVNTIFQSTGGVLFERDKNR